MNCEICGEPCLQIIPDIKVYCCWHVPTESIKIPREKWMCKQCKYTQALWNMSTRYNDYHVWDDYEPTKEPEIFK